MIPGYEGPTTPEPVHSSDDTIEIEIGDHQRLADATAPASACNGESRRVLPPEYPQLGARRSARIDFVCNVTLALIALGFVIGFFWPRWDPDTYAPPAASTLPLAEGVATISAEPPGAPLRIANAFDAAEVFEFPYGTSESEARDAVSELLLARARERHAQRPTRWPATGSQRGRGARFEQSTVFVTRLLARARTDVFHPSVPINRPFDN